MAARYDIEELQRDAGQPAHVHDHDRGPVAGEAGQREINIAIVGTAKPSEGVTQGNRQFIGVKADAHGV
jgi:hypothetical protein